MRRISQCLNVKLEEIFKHTQVIKELDAKLLDYLPKNLRTHFKVGSFKHGYLVLITPDPIWASQLRYYLPELRDKLRKEAGIYQLTTIKINVTAYENPKPTPGHPPRPISRKAQDTILATSELCEYIPLKSALKQLATRIRVHDKK